MVGGLCDLSGGDGVEDASAIVVVGVGDGGKSDFGEEVVEVVVEVAVEVGGGRVHGEVGNNGEHGVFVAGGSVVEVGGDVAEVVAVAVKDGL